jgi:hypothetical protein
VEGGWFAMKTHDTVDFEWDEGRISLVAHEFSIGYCLLLAFAGTTKVKAKAAACFSHFNDLQNSS